jgi:hypothetical protein
MPNFQLVAILLLLATASGCAENTAYETAQRSAQSECTKEPTQELYQRCMKNNSTPYREYKAEKNRQ